MSEKHTPAPWRLQGGRDVVSDRHTKSGLVAAVYAGAGPDEEMPANARLICASPCLLAALKDLLSLACREEEWRDVLANHRKCNCDWCAKAADAVAAIRQAKEVLAKAEGR